MRFLFALIVVFDLIVMLASHTTDHDWAYTVCAHLNDLCDYQTAMEVIAILSFGMMVVTWGY